MLEDPERCYQAMQSKDDRFDGWFYVGVLTTRIYCRPSCPARTPKRDNVRFYRSPASAQQAGLRACRRCRPDATPGSPEWNLRADNVARAMRLIRDGFVDREGVTGLARRLNYSERQLHRLMTAELGVGPLALARAQRSRTARVLLETTELSVTDVAFAAGFTSVRQYNDTIRQVFADTPTGLRRRSRTVATLRSATYHGQGLQSLQLRLPARRPLQYESILHYLSRRTIDGIEATVEGRYIRSVCLAHGYGILTFEPCEKDAVGPPFIHLHLQLSDLRDLTMAVDRCRQLLDLDADPVAIDNTLLDDPVLGPLVSKNPGLRVPGTVDGFELAVRAIIGQQVSVQGARTVASRLVRAAGEELPTTDGTITHLFPTPSALLDLAATAPEIFSMPSRRRQTLVALAEAVLDGTVLLDTGADRMELRHNLEALPGIGPWTSEYVAMRALRDPDAFMPSDLGIIRAVARLDLPTNTKELSTVSDRWRPWRSYAMAHLWMLSNEGTSKMTATALQRKDLQS
ncbi:MAG: AlkA N-terminal domain-containing protein [Acidimicrobiales bacterium]